MIKITTDSTCDLPAQLLEQHHISVIPLGIVKGGELFRDGENITTADIAAHVDAGGDITTTNAVSIGDYEALFARESARNDAVIHLNIGIGFSCCHQNACLAAEEFDNVHVVDTANLSVGHGLLVLLAAEAAEAGKVQYLDILLKKAAQTITKAGVRTDTPQEGVAALVAAGVINTPEYWLANYGTFPSLDLLLQALGGAVK